MSGYSESFTYDSIGRPSTRTLTTDQAYAVDYAYTSQGLWTANTQNVRGQTTKETLGNGVETVRSFDAVTGWLNSIQSGPSAGLQNLGYAYDLLGNVTQRQENSLGLTENFYYDDLYRLTSSQVGSNTAITYNYDAMGNITSRKRMGLALMRPRSCYGPATT